MTQSFLTITIPQGAHEATSAKDFGDIQDWPFRINRTPDRPEYQACGERGGEQPTKNAYYTAATTALLLGTATEPTAKGKNLTLEQQYMRRKGKNRMEIRTPKPATSQDLVTVRIKQAEEAEKAVAEAKAIYQAIPEEYIPDMVTNNKGERRHTDRARYTTEETPVTAKNIIVRTNKALGNYGKEKSKQKNQRAHVESIDRRQWQEYRTTGTGREKTRLWEEPYRCPMSPEAFITLTAGEYGAEWLL